MGVDHLLPVILFIVLKIQTYVNAVPSDLKVGITVLSDSKTLSTYYNLGSSATLVCHVQNTAGPVTYHWQSTNTDFFAYNSSSMFNRKRLLSAADAGVHTCTVTDDEGNTGSAMLPMMFQGIGLYVTKSYGKEESVLTNNSAILYYPSSCSDCSVEFYCFSNSTQSGVGDVVFPDGSVHTYNHVERQSFSSLRVEISNSRPITGLFTCRLPDSNNNTLEASIALFNGWINRPRINVLLSGYTDYSMDAESSVLVEVYCYTTNSPPTTVTWKRDGINISSINKDYQMLQVVVNRASYHYRNILLLMSACDILENHTFTCEVENSAGITKHDITVNISVTPESKVDVVPESSSGLEGEVITLSCTGSVVPMKATAQLAPYITTEWVGPTGVSLTHENDITLSQPIQSDSGVVQTLTINGTMYYHSGVYSCIVTLNGSQHVSEYFLMIKKNVTIFESEEDIYERNHTEDSMVCVWDREPLTAMEWIFLGDNKLAPLTAVNIIWDMESLKCWIITNSTVRAVNKPFHIEASVIKNIRIKTSSNTPVAGKMFKMTCSADSDKPLTLTWTGPNGEVLTPMNNQSILIETTASGDLDLVFKSLRTSLGGLYTCTANLGKQSTAQTKYRHHHLRVKIPNPNIMVNSRPSIGYSNGQLSVMCSVSLAQEVDTLVRVSIRWNAPSHIYGNNRIILVTDDSSQSLVKNSTLLINPVTFDDDGLYTCNATIESNSISVVGGQWATEEVKIDIALNVSISVSYSSASDLPLPRHSYYYPVSNVNLTCVAPPDAVPPLSYRWSSTCSSCSVAGSSSRQITINILKSSDAGVHTCTVTDRQSHTGSAATTTKKIGALKVTGNDVPLISGRGRNVSCMWKDDGLVYLAWYLEGLYTTPLVSTTTSSSLTLNIDPRTTGLNGTTFVCRATDDVNSTYQKATTIFIQDIVIAIEVSQVAPADYNFPAPYYRPATSLTLSCTVIGASQPVSFHWSSSNSQSFAYSSSNSVISKSITTAYDSGIHTCTVTDTNGITMSASSTILLYGVGLYYHGSRVDNSALTWISGGSVLCYSYRTRDYGFITVPNGSSYRRTHYTAYSISQLSPSAIQLELSSYNEPPTGIYTCRMGGGSINFGIYSTAIDKPWLSSIEFINLANSSGVQGLGRIVCRSSRFPPTYLSWKRNNISISFYDGSTSYRQIQSIYSRTSSTYSNTLIVMDLQELLGNPVYTCIVGNDVGTSSMDIQVSYNVYPNVSISTEEEPVYQSGFRLSCRAVVPVKLFPHLLPFMSLTWLSSHKDEIATPAPFLDGPSLVLNLVLPTVTGTHNGLYTCQLVLDIPHYGDILVRRDEYSLHISVLKISAERSPLIFGVLNEIICTLRDNEPLPHLIEMTSSDNEPFAVASATRNLRAFLTPVISMDGGIIKCLAHYQDAPTYTSIFPLSVKELVHDVRIEMEPVVPVAGERFTLSCIATADFPTTLSWRQLNGTNGNVSSMTVDGKTYLLELTFDSLKISDEGLLECVSELNISSPIISDKYLLQVQPKRPNITVSITVNYSAPSDFSLPSPPYYRPASSVTLTCVAHNAVGPVTYEWFSTSNSSFANRARGQTISTRILTAYDSGNHTCIARDMFGNTGVIHTVMILYGAGIYVEHSQNITNTTVANNTPLKYRIDNCNKCRFSFYCLSNFTALEDNSWIWYPGGTVYPNTTDSYIRVLRHVSGIYVSNSGNNVYRGVYMCYIPDTNGNIFALSTGIYDRLGVPYVYNSYYYNHLHEDYIDDILSLYCSSQSYLPTSVVWRKNGTEIPIDGHTYQTYHVVTDVSNSMYDNYLVLRDIAELSSHVEYTCEVINAAGSTNYTVEFNIPPEFYHIPVSISGHPTLTDGSFTLECFGDVQGISFSLRKIKITDYVTVEWRNNDGLLSNSSNITIMNPLIEDYRLKSTLILQTFNQLHSNVYTCKMSLNHYLFEESIPEYADFTIEFSPIPIEVEYFQLRFTDLSYHELNSRTEDTIIETLVSVIEGECNCGFSSTMIDNGEFFYNRGVSYYRARIIGTSLSAYQPVNILNSWKYNDGTFIFKDRALNKRVWINSNCPIQINSFSTGLLCD